MAARAGLLKAGIGYWRISPFERRVLDAVAQAHRDSGAPVMVHTEHAHARPTRCSTCSTASGWHRRGSRSRTWTATPTPACTPSWPPAVRSSGTTARRGPGPPRTASSSTASRAWPRAGHADAVLLGGDVARAGRFTSYGGMPGMAYLGDRFVPRLRRQVGEDVTHQVLVSNPARWLAWHR